MACVLTCLLTAREAITRVTARLATLTHRVRAFGMLTLTACVSNHPSSRASDHPVTARTGNPANGAICGRAGPDTLL
jgi:hypothetical protein